MHVQSSYSTVRLLPHLPGPIPSAVLAGVRQTLHCRPQNRKERGFHSPVLLLFQDWLPPAIPLCLSSCAQPFLLDLVWKHPFNETLGPPFLGLGPIWSWCHPPQEESQILPSPGLPSPSAPLRIRWGFGELFSPSSSCPWQSPTSCCWVNNDLLPVFLKLLLPHALLGPGKVSSWSVQPSDYWNIPCLAPGSFRFLPLSQGRSCLQLTWTHCSCWQSLLTCPPLVSTAWAPRQLPLIRWGLGQHWTRPQHQRSVGLIFLYICALSYSHVTHTTFNVQIFNWFIRWT